MKKRWLLPTVNPSQVQALQTTLGLPSVIGRLLLQRGIQRPEEALAFFEAGEDQCHDPFLMKDMDRAVQRLQRAINQQEKILLYGDYDVDGTTAVALLHTFLSPLLPYLEYYIPDRYREGYGLSVEGMRYAQETGVDLILCLDCGIKAVAVLEQFAEATIDVIICDHHRPGPQLPPAFAILNPQQADCPYPYSELCGAGVAFKLAQAYALATGMPERGTEDLLDLLVLAIACDIVPLTGENRALARMGLERLAQTDRPGLRALIKQSQRLAPQTISDLVFGIGPVLNAAGRLGDARRAVELLLAKETQKATLLAHELAQVNESRKNLDRQVTEEAIQWVEAQQLEKDAAAWVLFQPHWHQGVLGIAASRLAEHFHRPCILLTQVRGKLVGSARSVPGFDLYHTLGQCAAYLESYGGHTYAAGLRLLPEELTAFQSQFQSLALPQMDQIQSELTSTIDAEVAFHEISDGLWQHLRRLAPFGPGNPNPVFMTRQVVDDGSSRILKGQHVKLGLLQGTTHHAGIAFGQASSWEEVANGAFDICYSLQENQWRGKRTLQLVVKDMAPKLAD